MSAAAIGRAHPEGDDRCRLRFGPGHQREHRHELGVDGEQGHRRTRSPRGACCRSCRRPPWTDAISSSAERRTVPPVRSIRATDGSTNAWPPATATTSRPTTTVPLAGDRRPDGRPAEPAPQREDDGEAGVDHRDEGQRVRGADPRDHDERDEERADDGADRVRSEEQAGPAADLAVRPRDERGRGREAQAHDERRRQDDEGARPQERVEEAPGRAVHVEDPGRGAGDHAARPRGRPGLRSPAGPRASSPTVFRIHGRITVKAIAPRAIPIRNRARIIVNT